MESADAARILLRRRRMRASLTAFAQSIQIPGAPVGGDDTELFAPVGTGMAKHHILLCDALQNCIEQDYGRLMVFMPPGAAKSSYSSAIAPAWAMGRWPGFQVILASYGTDLAKAHARKARAICKQGVYRDAFGASIESSMSAAELWSITNGSQYRAAGLLAGITGNRADCLLAGTMIETEQGAVAIEHLVDSSFSGNVLSYEHNTGELVFRPVKAVARRHAESFYRIRTSSGRLVEATGNHRFWTSTGWKVARLLAEGDSLLCVVPGPGDTTGVSSSEGTEARGNGLLLQQPVLGVEAQRNNGADTSKAEGKETETAYSDAHLRGLQPDIQASQPQDAGQILLAGMQGSRALDGHDGGRKPRMAQRREPGSAAAPLGAGLPEGEARDNQSGQSLRSLQSHGAPARPPHRHGRDEQSVEQLGDALRALPSGMACSGAIETQEDIVVMVERIREPATVYDIQVEGTECFFGNGICLHNCLIIDDPIKGAEAADSPAIRGQIMEAIELDAMTRLKPRGSVALIQTRWHPLDPAGQLLPYDYKGQSGPVVCSDGMTWTVLNIPAESEHADDPLGRAPGEMLWPEWFDEQHWTQYRAKPRMWASLYQQRPSIAGGNQFKEEWVKWYQEGDQPDDLNIYGADDYGAPKDDISDGDFTEFGIVGLDEHGDLWLRDWYFGQVTTDTGIREFCKLAKAWKPKKWFGEKGVIHNSIAGALNRAKREREVRVRHELLPAVGSKIARCESFFAMAEQGKVHFPETAWARRLVAQLCAFPVVAHDDGVDVCSLFGRALSNMAWAWSKPDNPDESLRPFSVKWLMHGSDTVVKKLKTM